MYDAYAQSGELYKAWMASSRTWARSGPVIAWQQTGCHRTRRAAQALPVIPELEAMQATEQAKQWDSELHTQLQRAGYLATRLVRWHAPSRPAVPASPPLQLPSPPTPLDATPAEWPVAWADDAALLQDADEVFADETSAVETAFERRVRAMPPRVKRGLRAAAMVLRWHVALCYWTAIGALGASIAAAVVLTACRVLPLADQEALSSGRPGSAGSSVLASMPRQVVMRSHVITFSHTCQPQVSAALSRSLSASLSVFADYTWLRPNLVVPRAGARGAGVLYRWLRTRVVVLPGLRHLAAARGRELGALLRQLTPSSPLFGLAQAAEVPTERGAAARRSTRRAPATPVTEDAPAMPVKSAPRSRRKAASVEDSPAAGTRSATRRAARHE